MSFDFVFIGAGLANLSLLYRMQASDHFKSKTFAIIEPEPKTKNDRTWCYWSTKQPVYPKAVRQKWSQLTFKRNNQCWTEHIAPYDYYYIQGSDFYAEVIETIKSGLNITWLQSKVEEVKIEPSRTLIFLASGEELIGSYVFNSSFRHSGNLNEGNEMKQHFLGLRLKVKNGKLPFDSVHLMDFSFNSDKSAVQFGYLLPVSEQEALIEYTEFSKNIRTREVYLQLLNDYLKGIDITDYEVIDEEFGIIPMSKQAMRDRRSDQFINMGTCAGLTKPTTGYTFQFVQKDADEIVKCLQANKTITQRNRPQRFKFYDSLLLAIIEKEPWNVAPIMQRLFSRNKFTKVLKFLDEESSLWDEIKIFLSLPWKPFLRQLI